MLFNISFLNSFVNKKSSGQKVTTMHAWPGCFNHGLIQQGVWVPFWTPKPLKSLPQDTQFLCEKFLKMSISSIMDFCHLHVIPMRLYKDIMPYFDKCIHVYG